eukprot:2543355-Pyramimonas_sp.AAC.1
MAGRVGKARHLGLVTIPAQQAAPEVERRIAAATSAHYSTGGFWSLFVPKAWRRTMLVGLVQAFSIWIRTV